MNLIKVLCDAAKAKEFVCSSNYYYECHICGCDGDNKRIHMDNILANDTTDEIVRFGVCDGCGICFYHKDYRSGSL